MVKIFTTKRGYYPNTEFFVGNVNTIDEAVNTLQAYFDQAGFKLTTTTKGVATAEAFDEPVEDAENAYKARAHCVEALLERPDEISDGRTPGEDWVDEMYYALMFKSFIGREDEGPIVQQCGKYIHMNAHHNREFYSPERDAALFARHCNIEAFLLDYAANVYEDGKAPLTEDALKEAISHVGFDCFVPATLMPNIENGRWVDVLNVLGSDAAKDPIRKAKRGFFLKALFQAITSWDEHFKGTRSLLNLVKFILAWLKPLVPLEKWKLFAWYGPERLRFYNFYEPGQAAEQYIKPLPFTEDYVIEQLWNMDSTWTGSDTSHELIVVDFLGDTDKEAEKLVHWFQAERDYPSQIADDCENSDFLKATFVLFRILANTFAVHHLDDLRKMAKKDGEELRSYCKKFAEYLGDVTVSQMVDFIYYLSVVFAEIGTKIVTIKADEPFDLGGGEIAYPKVDTPISIDSNDFFRFSNFDTGDVKTISSYNDSFWSFLADIIDFASFGKDDVED
jgi:hypothetical protein